MRIRCNMQRRDVQVINMLVPSAIFERYIDWKERSGKSGIPAAREAYGTSLYFHDLQPRINHASVPQGVPGGGPRARERKGDDKSGRTRRIEKVAPVGPGNGIPVLDSAGESSTLSCNKASLDWQNRTRNYNGWYREERGGFIGHWRVTGGEEIFWTGLFITP